MCTHGDVMPMLLDHYASAGVDIPADREWPKGCTWMLDTDGTGEVVRARYLPRAVGVTPSRAVRRLTPVPESSRGMHLCL